MTVVVVALHEDFNVETHEEGSFLDVLGLNRNLALHDVMKRYSCASVGRIYFNYARIGVLMTR